MKKLFLNDYEIILLEVELEEKISTLQEMGMYCGREKELLKKIYSISSSKSKKFSELIVKKI